MNNRYYEVTECPGQKATIEQLERLYQRYRFSKYFSINKRVLEVACGSGIGLSYLAEVASSVTGIDIDDRNISTAKSNNTDPNIDIFKADAHKLPFPDNYFDVILLLEAIYYLEYPYIFVDEAKRVLARNGRLIICTVNKDWRGFHPSKYSKNYYSVNELHKMLSCYFDDIEFYGAFKVGDDFVKDNLLSIVKIIASRLNIIPGSLEARQKLKRVIFGKLQPIPNRIYEDMTRYKEPSIIDLKEPTKNFKILYAVSKKA
jgi:ubiquinone/menaquinone biosynthesis C-methylase UbiE